MENDKNSMPFSSKHNRAMTPSNGAMRSSMASGSSKILKNDTISQSAPTTPCKPDNATMGIDTSSDMSSTISAKRGQSKVARKLSKLANFVFHPLKMKKKYTASSRESGATKQSANRLFDCVEIPIKSNESIELRNPLLGESSFSPNVSRCSPSKENGLKEAQKQMEVSHAVNSINSSSPSEATLGIDKMVKAGSNLEEFDNGDASVIPKNDLQISSTHHSELLVARQTESKWQEVELRENQMNTHNSHCKTVSIDTGNQINIAENLRISEISPIHIKKIHCKLKLSATCPIGDNELADESGRNEISIDLKDESPKKLPCTPFRRTIRFSTFKYDAPSTPALMCTSPQMNNFSPREICGDYGYQFGPSMSRRIEESGSGSPRHEDVSVSPPLALNESVSPVNPSDKQWLVGQLAQLFDRKIGINENENEASILYSHAVSSEELRAALLENASDSPPKTLHSEDSTSSDESDDDDDYLPFEIHTSKPLKSCFPKPDLLDEVPPYIPYALTPCQSPFKLPIDISMRPEVPYFKTRDRAPRRPIELKFPSPIKKRVHFRDALVSHLKTFDEVVQEGGSGFRILSILDKTTNTIVFPKYVPPSD